MNLELMKRFLLPVITVLLFGCLNGIKAQYVTIPDTTFVNWLNTNGFAGCLNGNQLDTTCSAVTTATSMSCNAVSIRDLTGIQYFKNLTYLDCSNDSIYYIPSLPPLLTSLSCDLNNLVSLPALPASLNELECADNQLTSLPALPSGFYELDCDGNQLTSLPPLPIGLFELDCNYNQITLLPALPNGLEFLQCGGNQFSTLPSLPGSLQFLVCNSGQLTVLPALPAGLSYLDCSSNHLTSLPTLPTGIWELDCYINQLTTLPALPDSLRTLLCYNNQFVSLPSLPAQLQTLECGWSQLSSLPTLPASLRGLSCEYNQLTTLPALPSQFEGLVCSGNPITNIPPLPATMQQLDCRGTLIDSVPALPAGLTQLQCGIQTHLNFIPALPDSLYVFDCSEAPNLTCLPQLKRVVNFTWGGAGFTCLPDYGNITNSTPALYLLPLCDGVNTNGCTTYWSISGKSYYDANNNCVFDSGDVGNQYVKVQLYSGGTLIQQVYSDTGGVYSFAWAPLGNYTVQVDTTNLPFMVECPANGQDSVSLTPADSLSYNNNFAFKCRAVGVDVGVNSIINGYTIPRPNTIFTSSTVAGDMSELYGAHCATGISGTVQMVFSGSITYVAPATGALTPTTVNGNTITWNIADYGAISDLTAFNVLFKIDSLAVPGTPVCFTVSVTPTTGDYNPSNNTLSYCFPVVASLDPNEKEVYPPQIDSANQWLTYTIRFQNTGTATAVNIRIVDTLNSRLDVSTFQLLAYSATNLTQISGNVVIFNFPNIILPDSATSDSASRGFVQYKIKVKNGLVRGNTIGNQASIYFDLNSPVATNTVTDSVLIPCTSTYASLRDTICSGATVYVGTHAHSSTGIYVDSLQTTQGCDSIVTLNLTVNPVSRVGLGDTICSGDTVYVGTHAHYTAGTYVDTLTNVGGCDSIVTLQLGIISRPVASFTTAPQVCPGSNDTIVFTGIAGPQTFINWNFDSANVPAGSNLGPYIINWSNGGTRSIGTCCNEFLW